jgi:low temperature requirement protein LtrA
MNDTAFGYLLLAIGITFVLGAVYVVTSHIGMSTARPKPPRGVHLPNPSALPVIMAVGGALLGAGLAFRADNQLANPFLAIPGLLVFLYAIVAWVRAAGREWDETEHPPHDDAPGH